MRHALSCSAFKYQKLKYQNNNLQTIISGGKANQKFEELKEILEETNQRILSLEVKITDNHNELMEGISKVKDTARKALDIGLQNVDDIKKIDEQQDRMRE